MSRIRVHPVTREDWDDFVRLFEAKGSPHYCWCTAYRLRDAQRRSKAEKKSAMHDLVAAGTPVGVLAYDGEEPIGWCSIAPRQTYVKLERSRTMPRVSAAPTWTVLCFFVGRAHRERGVAHALLRGAIAYARANGAQEIEAYPFDTANVSSTHRGHSSLFAAARFVQDGRRWSLALKTPRRGVTGS